MAFNSISEFIQMGNHGAYVWSTYALCLIVLSGLVVQTLLHGRKQRRQLKSRIQREQKS
ncbi:heme exporter protein CcmD [Maribrevibacterium harenarium]|uniref:Heme exporter protein D n=1 Tax=Maribrevibacterium harenarium TaxID=2589817 RepID=A0A501X2L3_9GAMM|nr:heme exporter protein CcmD [Maribrevibacterium harenarium]TPE54731.1 heme exporter protein CcmD [Maribrevibacterium harenarium]